MVTAVTAVLHVWEPCTQPQAGSGGGPQCWALVSCHLCAQMHSEQMAVLLNLVKSPRTKQWSSHHGSWDLTGSHASRVTAIPDCCMEQASACGP